MDLGRKNETKGIEISAQAPQLPDVTYPSFCLNDDVATKFAEAYPIKKDGEFYARVKLKIAGWADRDYGKNIDINVLEIEPEDEAKGDKPDKKDDDDDGEDKGKMKSDKPGIQAILD